MDVVSLGFRTDLALLRLGGSEVVDKGDHLVVRSPHNPTFWWGNFLLLQRPPSSGTVDRWLAAFAEEFPGRQHLAFGVDGTDGSAADLAAFAERGLDVEADTVMTATSVHPPPRPDTTAVYRQLTSDEDWAQDVALRVACEQRSLEPAGYLDFVERRAQTNRALTTSGRAAWFGAFLDGRLVSQLGVVALGDGLVRYQSVETHPDVRGRGFAGTLVHAAGRYAFDELGAGVLVMVADPTYSAIRVYRSVGFTASETQLQAERPST